MTLIQALNTPALREMIDSIDDLWSSLDRGDRREPTLERLLAIEVADLAAKGVDYDPRPVVTDRVRAQVDMIARRAGAKGIRLG